MTDLKCKIWTLIRGGSFKGYPRTVSGYPLTLNDCMENGLTTLTVYGKSTQSGNPTPTFPAAFSVCGNFSGNNYKIPMLITGGTSSYTLNVFLNEPLCNINDVRDTAELNIENKSAVLIKRIGHISLTGNESWASEGTATAGLIRYQIPLSNYISTDAVGSSAKCTHFTTQAGSPTWGIANTFALSQAYKKLYIRTNGSPVAEFKAWLQEQAQAGTPVEIYYQYETPITTDISNMINWSAVQKQLKGTITVSADTEVKPSSIKAVYYAAKSEGGN